jgi:hypothetical protein
MRKKDLFSHFPPFEGLIILKTAENQLSRQFLSLKASTNACVSPPLSRITPGWPDLGRKDNSGSPGLWSP